MKTSNMKREDGASRLLVETCSIFNNLISSISGHRQEGGNTTDRFTKNSTCEGNFFRKII